MRYTIEIHENPDPGGIRFAASVEGLEGCCLAEQTIDDLYRNAPGIIKDVIETSNEQGGNFPVATEFDFHICTHA